MLIDQIGKLDTSAIEFAQKRSSEAISADAGGFAAYLARVMDPGADRMSAPDAGPLQSDPKSKIVDRNATDTAEEPAAGPTADKSSKAARGTSGEPGDRAPGRMSKEANPNTDRTTRAEDGTDQSRVKAKRVLFHRAEADHTRGSKSKAAEEAGPKPSTGRVMRLEGSGEAGSIDVAKRSAPGDPLTRIAGRSDDASAPAVDTAAAAGMDRKVRDTVPQGAADTGKVRIEVVVQARDTRTAIARPDKTGKVDQGDDERNEQPVRAADKRGRRRIEVRDLRPSQDSAEKLHKTDSQDPGSSRNESHDGLRSEIPAGRTDSSASHARTLNRTAPAGSFEALRQTLADQTNSEIVRAARLVVRGENTGEIRLHLRPESLGSVRIALRMEEGHIAGRIFVENLNVKDVFEQNLSDLVRAFNASGLETGSLDVLLDGSADGKGDPAGGRSERVIRQLDDAVPLVQTVMDEHELIDLVV